MKKVSFILALIIVMSCALASCGSNYKAFKTDPEYVSVRAENPNQTISGVDGVKKSVPKDVKSLICFSPAAAIILRELGSAGIIKGVDKETAGILTTAKTLTVEQIAAESPDLVLITDTYDTAALDSAEITYFSIPEVMTLNDVKTLIKVLEKVVGSTNESLTVKIDNESTLAQQTTSGFANKYTAFIDLGDYETTGKGTYINEVLSICGCENVFAEDGEGILKTDKSAVIAANPEFIFTTSNKSVYLNDDDFENVKAVQNGNVYQIKESNIKYGTQNVADSISAIFQIINNSRNKK